MLAWKGHQNWRLSFFEDSRVKHVYLVHEQDEVSLLILDLAGLQIEEFTIASDSLYRLVVSMQCL